MCCARSTASSILTACVLSAGDLSSCLLGAKKVAAVALTNKTARTIWALMTNGERYREPTVTLP